MGYSGAGKTDSWKSLKLKILCQTPFNDEFTLLRVSSLKGPSLMYGWSKWSSSQKSSLATASGLKISPFNRKKQLITH